MRSHRLAIVAGLLALLGAVAWYKLGAPEEDDAPGVELTSLLPELGERPLTRLEIVSPEHGRVALGKGEAGWRVVEPLEARADQTAVAAALEVLSELEVTRVAATRADNHARLGVDEAQGLQVTVFEDDEPSMRLIVGHYSSSARATMVRTPEDERVLAVSGALRAALDKPLKGWRQRVFFGVEPDEVGRVTFRSPNGTFRFVHGDDGWALEGGPPEGWELDPEEVASRVTSLARFRGSDFAPRDVDQAQAATGADAPTVVVFETKSDPPERYELRVGNPAGTTKRADGTDKQMYFVQHDDDPVIYRTSKYLRDRLSPDRQALAREDEAAASQ